jgi:hypothetical protein
MTQHNPKEPQRPTETELMKKDSTLFCAPMPFSDGGAFFCLEK